MTCQRLRRHCQRHILRHGFLQFMAGWVPEKQHLSKAFCASVGVTETVNSPTFALVNQYVAPEGESVFHFDFYRIKKLEEVMDIGYEDYFYSGSFCLIEWPEMVEELLPPGAVEVKIEEDEASGRRIFTF